MSKKAKKTASKKTSAKRVKIHATVIPAPTPEAPATPPAPEAPEEAVAAPAPEANAAGTEAPGTKKGKKAKTPKAPKELKEKKPSGLDAAAKVLGDAGTPLNVKEMMDRILAQDLWQSDGQTPHATIYAAIIREIAQKGEGARFRKAERGKFTLAS